MLVALVISSQREMFYRSYLFAYMFWLGLALGCGGIAMLHNLTSGKWGQAARRVLEAGNGTMVVMAVLSLPLVIAVSTKHIYGWAGAPSDAHYGLHKVQFLTPHFVLLRGVIYFALWVLSSFMVLTGARKVERTGRFADARRFARFSGFGLVIYVLTVTGAALDWVMSLTPDWYSTMFGLIFVVGQVLSAFCFSVIVLTLLRRHHKPVADAVSIEQIADLGTFMFGFTILWAYTSFFQMLISWMGNLRSEMKWYVARTTHGWGFLAVCLILFQFFTPFLLLLSRKLKRTPDALIWVAAGIMFMRFVDIYWNLKPTFPTGQVSWMDLFLPVGVGGLFVWGFLWRLKAAPLTPPPLVDEVTALEAHAGHVGATEYGAAISRRKGTVA